MIAAVAAAPARRTRTPVLGEEGRAGQLCGAADTGSAMRDEIGACHARRRCDRSGPAEKARGMHVSVRGSCDGPAFVDFRDADDLGQHNVEIASSDGRDPLRHRCDAIISSGAARVRQRAPSFGLVPRNKPRSTRAAACKARGHRRRLDVGWPRGVRHPHRAAGFTPNFRSFCARSTARAASCPWWLGGRTRTRFDVPCISPKQKFAADLPASPARLRQLGQSGSRIFRFIRFDLYRDQAASWPQSLSVWPRAVALADVCPYKRAIPHADIRIPDLRAAPVAGSDRTGPYGPRRL
jgi:hypothetical protein